MKLSVLLKSSAPLLLLGVFLSALPLCAQADELRLMAVGDVLPHPSWQQFEIPVDKLFEGVKEAFFEADVVVGNLETPLTDKTEPTLAKPVADIKSKRDFVFKAEPVEVAQGLKDAGFTVLTLANNHMLDYREAGLLDTLDRLKAAGVYTAGAGINFTEAFRPCVVDAKGMELVFLSASDVVPKYYWAEPDKPGIASMKDEKVLLERIAAVRNEHPDALLVLCLHWGVEAALFPTARQKDLAHKFMDAGADLILGHHPHRLQGVEIYKGRPVFYSLGNFQFDTQKPGDESVIADIVYKDGSKEPAEISVKPVLIDAGGYPRVLAPARREYAVILNKMDEMSRPLGAMLKGEKIVVAPPVDKRGYDLSKQ